jgi:hypothetical protein
MIHTTNVIVAGVDMDVVFEFVQDLENTQDDLFDDVPTEFSDIDIISVYHGKDEWLVDLAGVLDEETLMNVEEQIMSLYE